MNQRKHKLATWLGALAFAAALTAQAASDKDFVKDAAKANQFAIQAGQLAEKQGNSEMVKNLGKQISADRKQANQQLEKVAAQKNFKTPTEPANKRDLEKLQGLHGAEFDKEYVDLMVKDQYKDVRKYWKQAQKSTDPAVKKYADGHVAMLQKDLQMSQQAQTALKNGTAAGGGAAGGEQKSDSK